MVEVKVVEWLPVEEAGGYFDGVGWDKTTVGLDCSTTLW